MVFYNPYNMRAITAGNAAMSYAPYGFKSFSGLGHVGGNTRYRTAGATQTLVKSRRKPKKAKNSFKSKLTNAEPAKHFSAEPTVALVHSTPLCINLTAQIVQGTTNATRLGDSIYLAALKMKGNFQSPAAASLYNYRILIGYSGEEYNSGSGGYSSQLTAAELFLPTTGTQWSCNGIINPKAFTVLYDQTFDINSQIASTSDISSFSFTVPLDKSFVYQATGSVYGKSNSLYVVVMACTALGVVGTTASGAVVSSYDLIFK